MKNLSYFILSLLFVSAFSCKKGEIPDPELPPPGEVLEGTITASKTLDATKKYTLKGNVFIASGAELTIPAGTVVMGDKATKGALIISRGAKIHAQGTADNPIIFTSSAPAGYRNRGDWGGVVILGNASNNNSANSTIEGISAATGDNGLYGGSNNTESSGELTYARIEFAGIALSPNNELNSLTMGSVGSGTQIHHIMVSYGGDDSYEWFGGSVDHKYLVSYNGWDDDFDTDRGYSGRIQYGIVLRDPSSADNSGSNGFEASSASNAGTAPVSRPKFSNMTVLGPHVFSPGNINANFGSAVDANKHTEIEIYNSILGGFPTNVRYNNEAALVMNNNLFLNVYDGNDLVNIASTSGTANANSSAGTSSNVNVVDLYGTNSFDITNPQVALSAGSAYKSNAPAPPTGFEATNFYGAFSDNANTADWQFTAGWINFNPINAQY